MVFKVEVIKTPNKKDLEKRVEDFRQNHIIKRIDLYVVEGSDKKDLYKCYILYKP